MVRISPTRIIFCGCPSLYGYIFLDRLQRKRASSQVKLSIEERSSFQEGKKAWLLLKDKRSYLGLKITVKQ
jgi:hypothetical protein